jgi:nitroreductase
MTYEHDERKRADADAPLIDAIRNRWSPRAFAKEAIEDERLDAIIHAARWAASSYNEQPWRFGVARKRDKEAFARGLDCLVEFNRGWAASADALVFTFAKKTFSHNGKPNRHAWHDVGMATAHAMLQARELDVYSHAMAGFDASKAEATFGVSDEYEAVAVLALGYLGDPDELPDDLAKQERAARTRKPLAELFLKPAREDAR